MVLKFLKNSEIKNLFDEEAILVINYLLGKTLFSQPEALDGETQGNIQITKEFLEQWIAQGLGWKKVGSGSYPIDVYSDTLLCGADVKFVSAEVDENNNFTSRQSGESSLGQKFRGSGNELDQDFAKREYAKIVNGWKDILIEKIKRPIEEYGLKNIYYFIFIRGGNSISLAIANVKFDEIKNIEVGRATSDSVFVDNYIEDAYGNVKIYKAKKRMELRCFPKKMKEDDLLIEWKFDNLNTSKGINLRSIASNNQFNNHIKEQTRKFFNL